MRIASLLKGSPDDVFIKNPEYSIQRRRSKQYVALSDADTESKIAELSQDLDSLADVTHHTPQGKIHKLCVLLYSLNRIDEAINLLNKTIETALIPTSPPHAPNNDPDICKILNAPATCIHSFFSQASKSFGKLFLKEISDTYGFLITPPINPRTSILEFLLGNLHYHEGEFALALKNFYRSVMGDPTHVKTFVHIALTYLEMKKFDEGLLAIKHSLKLDPSDTIALDSLLTITIEKTRDFLESAGDSNPSEQTREPEKQLKIVQERTEWCLKLVKKVLESSNDASLRQRLGMLHELRGEYTAARSLYEGLIKECSTESEELPYLLSLGRIALIEGSIEESLQLVEKVNSLEPSLPAAYILLTEVHCTRNATEEAVKTFEKCINKCPEAVAAHSACGMHLCDKGMESVVLEVYRKFIERDPHGVAAKAFTQSMGSPEGFARNPSGDLLRYAFLPLVLILLLVVLVVKPFWDEDKAIMMESMAFEGFSAGTCTYTKPSVF